MKYLWYLISIFTIVIILINNPKSSSLGNMGNQGPSINLTRSTQHGLQIGTIISMLSFLVLTILINMYSMS